MKKRILRVFLALTVFILLLSLPVHADEAELYQNSGADALMEALPEEAQSLLQNAGADPMETPAPDAATKLFSALSEGFRAEWTAPARALLTLLVSCVLCRLVQEFAAKELSYAVSVCGALCAAVTLLSPMASLLEQAARVTDAAAVFLLAAVPVYTGLLCTAGNTVTAPTYGALSLAAANAVSVLSSAYCRTAAAGEALFRWQPPHRRLLQRSPIRGRCAESPERRNLQESRCGAAYRRQHDVYRCCMQRNRRHPYCS